MSTSVDSAVEQAIPAQPRRGAGKGAGSADVSLAKGAALTAFANGILPITSLLTGPILARALGPVGRGEMNAVLAPLFVANFVAAVSMPEATTYAIATLKVPVRRAALTSSQLLILFGAIAGAGIWWAAPVIEHGTPTAIPLLRQAVWALPLLMVALMQRFAVAGDRRYGYTSLERTTAALSRMLLLFGLAGFGFLDSRAAIWTNISANLLALMVLFVPIVRSRPKPDSSSLRGWALRRTMLGYGVRGWGGVFANLVNWRLDQAIMPAIIGPAGLGYYAIAVSLAEIPSMLIGQTKQVIFAEAAARGDQRLVARAARAVLFIAFVVDAVLILAAPLVIRIMFGRDFMPSVGMTRLLLLGNIPFTGEVILAAGLLALGRPGLRSIGQLVAAALTVGGLIALLPVMGPIGAAWVSLAAYSINFLMTLAFFTRVTNVGILECLLVRPSDLAWLRQQLRPLFRKLFRLGRRATGASSLGRYDMVVGGRILSVVVVLAGCVGGTVWAVDHHQAAATSPTAVTSAPASSHPSSGTTRTNVDLAIEAQLTKISTTLATMAKAQTVWSAAPTTLRSDMATVRATLQSEQAALTNARDAHRQKPQNCSTVGYYVGQTQDLAGQVDSALDKVDAAVTVATKQLTLAATDIAAVQKQIDAADAAIAKSRTAALSAESQRTALASLSAAHDSALAGVQQVGDSATHTRTVAQLFAGQADALPPLCARETAPHPHPRH